jgi:hypothetical protein
LVPGGTTPGLLSLKIPDPALARKFEAQRLFDAD